jgi:hypothetical protein
MVLSGFAAYFMLKRRSREPDRDYLGLSARESLLKDSVESV